MSIVADTSPSAPVSRLAALIDPPAACPGCLAQAGQPWPADTTSRFCPRCRDRMRRVHQVKRWNRDHTHQTAAGVASFTAFSARWRASQGIAPLMAAAARRYVTPPMIRQPSGAPLASATQAAIHQAWCAGKLYGVLWWTPDRLAALATAPTDERQASLFDAATLHSFHVLTPQEGDSNDA